MYFTCYLFSATGPALPCRTVPRPIMRPVLTARLRLRETPATVSWFGNSPSIDRKRWNAPMWGWVWVVHESGDGLEWYKYLPDDCWAATSLFIRLRCWFEFSHMPLSMVLFKLILRIKLFGCSLFWQAFWASLPNFVVWCFFQHSVVFRS